ncbi:hypothetical protein ACOI1H_12915, partial [Loktanella sp. DJP18]
MLHIDATLLAYTVRSVVSKYHEIVCLDRSPKDQVQSKVEMSRPSGISVAVPTPHDVVLLKQMKDYAAIGMKLVWQRAVIFVAALVLAGFYYSLELALAAGAMIVVSEAYDYIVLRQIMDKNDDDA